MTSMTKVIITVTKLSRMAGEDPDIFQTKRGWHMLNHNDGLSATRMWISKDGVHWQRALGMDAFTNKVLFTNGTSRRLCW